MSRKRDPLALLAYNQYMKIYMRKYRAKGIPKICITGIGVIK
jgi:hypothetical protein